MAFLIIWYPFSQCSLFFWLKIKLFGRLADICNQVDDVWRAARTSIAGERGKTKNVAKKINSKIHNEKRRRPNMRIAGCLFFFVFFFIHFDSILKWERESREHHALFMSSLVLCISVGLRLTELGASAPATIEFTSFPNLRERIREKPLPHHSTPNDWEYGEFTATTTTTYPSFPSVRPTSYTTDTQTNK